MTLEFETGLSSGVSAALSGLSRRLPNEENKVSGAATDFESLLIGQVLRSSRSDGGWLGTDDDDAGEAAIGLGEEQLAHTMAASGGLGLSRLIESGLRHEQDSASTVTPALPHK